MNDILDFTDKYNTILSDKDEAAFQQWAKANNRLEDLATYDMRGWWDANRPSGIRDPTLHFPDIWKKPNHPTFSIDSMYAPYAAAGKWSNFGPENEYSLYQATADQLASYQVMRDYLAHAEKPGSWILEYTEKLKK